MLNTPEDYIAGLNEVTEKKYRLLQDMLLITQAQSGVINEDGMQKLDKLISEKQARIEQIDKLDEIFNVYFKRLKFELKVDSLDEIKEPGRIKGIKELQASVKGIIEVIEKISGIEKDNDAKAKSLLSDFAGDVRKLNEGKKAYSAYNPTPVQPTSYYIDKKK